MKEKLNLTPDQIKLVELYAAYGLQLEFLAVVPENKQNNEFYSGSVCIVNQKIAGYKYSLTLMLTTSAKYYGVKSMWLCEEDGVLSEKNILTNCDTIFSAISNPITVISMYWKFFRRTEVQEEQKKNLVKAIKEVVDKYDKNHLYLTILKNKDGSIGVAYVTYQEEDNNRCGSGVTGAIDVSSLNQHQLVTIRSQYGIGYEILLNK